MDVNRRYAISNGGAAVAIIVILVASFLGYTIYMHPGAAQNVINPAQNSSTNTNAVSNTCGNTNPIQSELTSNNGQTVTSPTVNTYIQSGQGWSKFASGSGSLTQNSLNTASVGVTLPIAQVYNGSAVYPTTVVVTSPNSQTVTDPLTGASLLYTQCSTPASSSNNVATLQMVSTVFTGPASGRTATTNVETVFNSQTSQTNSFPTAFPTSAPVTVTLYLQVFSANTVAGRPVTLPGNTNAPITDYGGISCAQGGPGTASAYEQPTSNVIKTGFACYQPYTVIVANQTQWSFTSLSGPATKLQTGISGTVSYMVPVTCNSQPSAASGVSTSNPYIACQVSFQVQELISATGHHIDLCALSADNSQGGYISQTFTPAAAGSFPAAGNNYGLPSGFSGLYPSAATGSNAPDPLYIQHSCAIATW